MEPGLVAAGGRASPPSTAVDSSRMGQNPWIFGRHSHILMSNDHSVYRQSAGPKHPIPRQFGRLEPSAIQTRIGRIRSADSARGRNTSSPWLEFVESAERSSFSLEGPPLPPRMTGIARPVFSARAFAIQGAPSIGGPSRDCLRRFETECRTSPPSARPGRRIRINRPQ